MTTTWGPWVKTAIAQHWGAGLTIVLRSPEPGKLLGGDFIEAIASLGQAMVAARYLWTWEDAGVTYNRFEITAHVGQADPWVEGDHRAVDVLADGGEVSWACTLSVEAILKERWGAAPLNEKAYVTHSKEAVGEDAWFPADDQHGTATIGDRTQTNLLTAEVGPADAQLNTFLGTQCHFVTGDLLRFEQINFNGAAIDAVGLTDRALTPSATGSSWTGEVLRAVGAGQTIRYYYPAETQSATFTEGEWIKAPRVYKFTGLDVSSMGSAAP